MRILFFLILSSFLLSQPTVVDTTEVKDAPSAIPVEVKPAVQEIVNNSEEAKKASLELNKEMKKQLDLMKQIKSKITELKRQSSPKRIEKVSVKHASVADTLIPIAIKPNDMQIQVNGQLVKYETRKTTLFGKVIHTAYYPYIQGEKGRKIYLK